MNKRRIKKITVLGSGVMGSQIACHFANIGVEVLLLDMAQPGKDKNEAINMQLKKILQLKPSPIYHTDFIRRITVGNFDDDLKKISECDWVLEAIVENSEIKKELYSKIEEYRKKGTLITSNTSGIPIQILIQGRSEDFQNHFCGTHFFNPPRYLKLLEIIPSEKTHKEVTNFLEEYGNQFLGKTTLVCKDTPAFIGNRIGLFSIVSVLKLTEKFGFTIDEIDTLTGTIIGRPKSATYRTADIVGLDVISFVANGLKDRFKGDEKTYFELPHFFQLMIEKKLLGEKKQKGFYKKEKDKKGERIIDTINLNTLEYSPQEKPRFSIFNRVKLIEDPLERIKILLNDKDKVGSFYRQLFFALFEYASHKVPEISNELYKLDEAIKTGFNWEHGVFEIWESLGLEQSIKHMENEDFQPAQWVKDLVHSGKNSFYIQENDNKKYYDIDSKEYQINTNTLNFIYLRDLKENNTIWSNSDAHIIDLGDGIINVEFHTKMNTLTGGVLSAINKAIDIAENEYEGIVLSNEGPHFSAGANVGIIFMLAIEQEFDELSQAITLFQNTIMRIRYSSIPVVAAPHGLTLGGGCEICLHADKVIAHAETYIGLVEAGVGVIPAGGGTKEFALRLSDELKQGDIAINRFRERFLTLAQAKVTTSAYEGYDLGYFRKGIDEVISSKDRQLKYAKRACLKIVEKGYTQPIPRQDIKVMGQEGMGIVLVGANSFHTGNYISQYDRYLAEQLGKVLSGGYFSGRMNVSEQYLLNKENEIFVKLCSKTKTLERMQSLLNKGIILRN